MKWHPQVPLSNEELDDPKSVDSFGKDIKLDDTGDIVFENNDFSMTTGADNFLQGLKIFLSQSPEDSVISESGLRDYLPTSDDQDAFNEESLRLAYKLFESEEYGHTIKSISQINFDSKNTFEITFSAVGINGVERVKFSI